MRVVSAILGLALLAPACGTRQPPFVSLATLAADQESYQGKQIRTTGLVERFTDPSGPYFVIEDAAHNRVEVLPASRMAEYEGRRIEVTGRFDFNHTIGRFLRVEQVSISAG